jgi:mannitol-1-phosphate 5-dehydrogenase
MKLVVFGAGNIGRSFVGQLFARAGYRVVFVDIDDELVAALNREGRYRIEIRDRCPDEIWVEGVSAIHARDAERVASELAEADIAATAVGPSALPHVYPAVAQALVLRRERGAPPLDIIICENLRDAAGAVATGLRQHLPRGFPLDDAAGLIETSIGKMVPIMPEEVRRSDPLLLYAEAYNTLILDATAFKNPIPGVPGLDPKENMRAYVDRKAFIHNCGHAACAYLGHLADSSAECIWQVVERAEVQEAARHAMWESARALIRRYPDEFDEENQSEHIEDLLSRFANEALGDTIYRVGRDLPRKLSRDDRLVGALLLDAREGVPAPATTVATAAGFLFRSEDEHGAMFPADEEFSNELERRGEKWALSKACGLREDDPAEAPTVRSVERAFAYLRARSEDWLRRFLSDPGSVLASPP